MQSSDNYSDTSASPSTATASEDESAAEEETEDTEAASGLLPRSMFDGHDCKPGSKYTVEVTDVFEDEVSVRLANKNKSSDTPEYQGDLKD